MASTAGIIPSRQHAKRYLKPPTIGVYDDEALLRTIFCRMAGLASIDVFVGTKLVIG